MSTSSKIVNDCYNIKEKEYLDKKLIELGLCIEHNSNQSEACIKNYDDSINDIYIWY